MKEVLKYTILGLALCWTLPLFIATYLPYAACQLMFKDEYPKHSVPDLGWQVQQWFKESSADRQWRQENMNG